MKPKGQTEHEAGLLEYLEDVIGSNHYVDEIAEKGANVETLNEERAMKLDRVKAVEGERENLEVRRPVGGCSTNLYWCCAGCKDRGRGVPAQRSAIVPKEKSVVHAGP